MEFSDTINKIARYITNELELPGDKRFIVGLSGGADSVALLDILNNLKYPCIAAHCNFNLRGEESERDRLFAETVAKTLNVPFEEISFDTCRYAENKKISIEMACRELRYDWFEKIRKKESYEYIAIAHHSDDAIETFFLNLMRGSGISGLTGIRPVNGRIVRPLLCISRQEIETYLQARGLPFITDSTNLTDAYTRNKIRLNLIPLLQEISPSIKANLKKTLKNIQEAERVYKQSIDAQIKEITYDKGDTLHIGISQLLNTPSPICALIEILKNYGFSPTVCSEILSAAAGRSGKTFYSETHRVIKDRTTLIVSEIPKEDDQMFEIDPNLTSVIKNPLSLTFSFIENKNFKIPKQKNTACFDAQKLSYPLTVRKWKQGDRFQPFGMKGYKKISDYFSDHKFSIDEKEKTFLLCSGDEIIWIIGERASQLYCISDETEKILQASINKC